MAVRLGWIPGIRGVCSLLPVAFVLLVAACSSGDDGRTGDVPDGAAADSGGPHLADADAGGSGDDALPYLDLREDVPDVDDPLACVDDSTCPGLLAPGPCEESVCRDRRCVVVPAADGTACDDGRRCSTGDACQDGVCTGGGDEDCDDGNPCTDDGCTEAAGCVSTPNDRNCDDANPCTVLDRCADGACRGTPSAQSCPCGGDEECLPYDDADRCNGTFACVGGGCVAQAAVVCPQPADPCLVSTCDPATGGCADGVAPAGAACDDGDGCTVDDACHEGVCEGVPGGCDCVLHEDCAAFDNGDRCDGIWQCLDGQCRFAPESVVDCGEASQPCRRKVCEPGTGACREIDQEPGIACEDGDACTSGETCMAGQCGGGAPVVCDDGNPCTYDRCDVFFGCRTTPALLDCDDGDPCTTADRCVAGVCRGGAALDCDDGEPCTADRCEPALGGCVNAPVAAPCSDGNPCSDGDTCVAGRCVAGTVDLCGTCGSDAECAAYEDGDLCNGVVRCVEGICRVDRTTVVTCPAPHSPCRVATCVPATGVCQEGHRPNGTPCDDGNACTEVGVCSSGVCVTTATACDDDNPCTQDTCAPVTGCAHTPVPGGCDDGNRCTRNDICAGGVCRPGAVDDCGPCSAHIDCAPGDDLDVCNGQTRCLNGRCVLAGDSLVTCPEPEADSCLTPVCDAATGACGTATLGEGTACDDGDACTRGDACTADGECAGAARDCDDGNPCTDDSCDAVAGCLHVDNAAPCQDANLCTASAACVGGRCTAAAPVVCDDGNPCTTDQCDPASGECLFTDNTGPCDDGSACTVNDTCGAGACVGLTVACEDGNPCTGDVCDPAIGCLHQAYDLDDCEGGPCECDDAEPCTLGDYCTGGICQSGVLSCGEFCANGLDDELDGLTDCDDPDCEALPTCQGVGACEPVGDVACLGLVTGSLTGDGATNQVDSYPTPTCVGASYDGPELAWRYVSECDGIGLARLTVTAAANPTRPRIDVFVLRANNLGQCVAATGCFAKGIITWIGQTGTAEAWFNAEAGQTYFLVADGQLGAVGDFTLEAICFCN